MKRRKVRPGDFFAIPLASSGYGYARALDKLMAVYNLKTENIAGVDIIEGCKVLFITAVRTRALSSDCWIFVGNKILENSLQKDVKFFRPNPSGNGFLIYVSKANPGKAYEEYSAPMEECAKLEPLLVWEPEQIKGRIEDYFCQRQNEYLKSFYDNLT